MSILQALPILSTVSFEVYPSSILGTRFTRVKVEGILDAHTARSLGFDPWALHANVYPTLPAGTPNDPTAYLYVKVKLSSGGSEIVGVPWIRPDSITELQLKTAQIKVLNVGPDDLPKIVQALSANGFAAHEVTLT